MEENVKPTVGRPTKYEDWMVEDILARAKCGQCMQFIAMEWNVARDSLFEWTKVHKDFSDAYTRAKEYFNGWLWQQTVGGMHDRNFNDRVARLLLGAFAKYTDSRNVKTNQLKEALEQKDYAKACGIVAEQADKGQVTADEFCKMMDTVNKAANAHKVGELDERMFDLEEAVKEHAK